MNKKLIKTIASVTCGLGIASSIPFITTSCGSSKPEPAPEPEPTDKLYDGLIADDFSVDTANGIINGLATSGTLKLNSIKNTGEFNGIKLPSDFAGNDLTYYIDEITWNDYDFIKIIEIPSKITKIDTYYNSGSKYAFPSTFEKIIFDADSMSFKDYDSHVFGHASNVNTIIFNNISNRSGFQIDTAYRLNLTDLGKDATGKKQIKFAKGADITDLTAFLQTYNLPDDWEVVEL